MDAKTQYVSACNTVETLLVHEDVRDQLLPMLKAALDAKQVELRGTKDIAAVVDCVPATEADDRTEYLDYILSAKTVKSVEEAIAHINRFGSHHTDCIITENPQTAEHFMNLVDSAGVYQTVPYVFADGYRYGFGAEVGISTGKLHARGRWGWKVWSATNTSCMEAVRSWQIMHPARSSFTLKTCDLKKNTETGYFYAQ